MDQIQSLILNPLKPYLLPITTNLPKPISDALVSMIGTPCHNALLHDLDITTQPECLSLAISKALGIAIITTASVIKIPQILKLLNSQSAAGLSITSYVLETASFLITLAYNVRSGWPFSTYGETALIMAQDVVIAVLVLHFMKRDGIAGTFVAGSAAAIYTLLVSDTLVDAKLMNYLQVGAGALSVASKLPQIWTVYREGGTGQLSAFAVFNYLAGSLSRIFTTLQEVDDKLILYGFLAGFVLNAMLAGQMVYYWNAKGTTAKHGEVSKKIPQAIGSGTGAEVKKGVASSTRRRG
jgi:mannose-P-dolichol utilization defect 1